VTAAFGCFLGVSLATDTDTDALTKAYGEFAKEAKAHNHDYVPETVNTDGWDATQRAWKRIFPTVQVILCFLHTVLGIQRLCRRDPVLFSTLTRKLWHLYNSLNRSEFAQRLRRFLEWAAKQDLPEPIRLKLLSLKAKAPLFKVAFEVPDAYRTSTVVDRLMNFQDRMLYSMQYFHGSFQAANQALRAMALLWNFHPYCRKRQVFPPFVASPFEDLNGFRYHDNWLRNLLIAASLNGRGTAMPTKHKLI
jgi:hypothetical protein